jgi:predicted AAA+ superfamily ATPase
MKKYIDILSNTFMLRILQPFTPNLSKRLTKSPKIYLRDTGILHSLLGIDSFDDLLAHPVLGASWETLVIENVITAMPGWEPFFYRTAAGAEIDLLLVRGRRKLAIECKSSAAPKISRGFWSSIEELGIEKAWVIAPVKDSYPIADNVMVSPLSDFKGLGKKELS